MKNLSKVSLIWVNYNSMHVIDYIKSSLESLMQLDYPNYELIVVDNGSTDGSRDVIKEFLESFGGNVETKLILLSRNYGFSGGVNAGYIVRDRRSRYVGVVNNDAIFYPEYLRVLVKFMELNPRVGAVQGLVLRLGSDRIDSAGAFIDELLVPYFIFRERRVSEFGGEKVFAVSFVEGTAPLYRVEAVMKSMPIGNRMFVTGGFAYFLEDVLLGLLLWEKGYRCVMFPYPVAEHYRKATIKKYSEKIRLIGLRNFLALNMVANSRFKSVIFSKHFMKSLFRERKLFRVVMDGIRLGRVLMKTFGKLNIYRAPLLKVDCLNAVRYVLGARFYHSILEGSLADELKI